MRVTLRHFALIRETVGQSSEVRDVADGTTIGSLYDELATSYPRLAPLKPSVMRMANQEYVKADYRLGDGDEVVYIPPVSGGATGRLFRITGDPLDPRETEQAVEDPGAGAIVTFTGVVRDNGRGRSVAPSTTKPMPQPPKR